MNRLFVGNHFAKFKKLTTKNFNVAKVVVGKNIIFMRL
jgi:hypothetical protein